MRKFSSSKMVKKPYALAAFLTVCALISVATLTREVLRNLKRIEKDFANFKEQQTTYEAQIKQKHTIEKRYLSENNSVWPAGEIPSVGTTYVRWGRRDCPIHDRTRLVYEGFAGGSHYSYVGGGSDFLCLHSDPDYTSERYNVNNGAIAHVFGVEYRDSSLAGLFDLSLIEGRQLTYQGVPCAVCLVNSNSQLMIPSRETCPDGWTIEYTGYIMTGGSSDTKHSSSHICVDDTPQAIPGTNGNQHGAYLYVAEILCGYNVLCEPYVNGREITCVVCSLL